jgi:hypothetical protein
MHWFDRISREVADPAVVSRRTVLKGGLAALALPFVPTALSRASGGRTGFQPLDATFCANCLARVDYDHREELSSCLSGGRRRVARPKGAGKKLTPAGAARKVGCQAKARRGLARDLLGCRKHFCSDSEEPAENPETGHSSCPGETSKCGATLCCYSGDSCCPCSGTPEGLICCAGVIGCTCC